MNLILIYEGDDACEQCLGWKMVADAGQESWKYWAELPAQSRLAVAMGIVKPVLCPRCNGTGKEEEEE